MLLNVLRDLSKKTIVACLVFFTFFAFNSNAEEPSKNQAKKNQTEKEKTDAKVDYDAILKEYKEFVKSTKPEIRDEIKKYRESVAELNKQKSNLYKGLSQEAQDYIKKERAIRFKIPLEDRREYIKKIYSNVNSGKN